MPMRAQPGGVRGWLLGVAGFAADTYLWVIVGLVAWIAVPAIALGWTPTVVSSGSMQPLIAPGDVVLLDRDRDAGRLHGPGSIVTFTQSGDPERWITHRVVAVDDELRYVTRGDANGTDDPRPVTHEQLVGVARLVVPLIGRPVAWYHAGARTTGVVVVLLTAAAAWLATRPVTDALPRSPAQTVEPPCRDRQAFRLAPLPRTDRPIGHRVAPRRARPGGHLVRPQHLKLQPISPRRAGRRAHPGRAAAGLGLVAAIAVGAVVPSSSATFAATSATTANAFAVARMPGPPVTLVLPPRDGQEVLASGQQNETVTFAFPVDRPATVRGTITATFEVRSSTPGNPGRDLSVELRLDGQTIASGSVELRDRSQTWYGISFDLAPPVDVELPAGSTLEVVVTFRRHDLRLTGGSLLTLPT
jgi:signal peptidase I